jgi:hypothetical protein
MTETSSVIRPPLDQPASRDGVRNMRPPVMWAIRDCRFLNASEKALLWAVESRGVHYGTWETVAADAGMKRDAYYRWRQSLEAKGVLSVTTRPGRTTLHRVNAEWFDNPTLLASPNQLVEHNGKTHPAKQNKPSANAVMKEDHEGDPVRGPSKVTITRPRKSRLLRADELEWVEPAEWAMEDLLPWDRV